MQMGVYSRVWNGESVTHCGDDIRWERDSD